MTQATSDDLTLDADHRYRLCGVEIPSVTQVINAVLPGWQADEWYLQRGTAVHKGCELFDLGTLDWSTVDPSIEGRIRAWESFRRLFPGVLEAVELPLAHPTYGFAGTLDRVIGGTPRGRIICDLKSSTAPQARVQLGAYQLLWNERPGVRAVNCEGVVVELREDGTYRCDWYSRGEIERSARTFLACLTVYNFRRRMNLK